jgi:hypothetical protein
MNILIFLLCAWLIIPLIRPVLILSIWLLTRRVFWIGVAVLVVFNVFLYQAQLNRQPALLAVDVGAYSRIQEAPVRVVAPTPAPAPVISAEEQSQKAVDDFAAKIKTMKFEKLTLPTLPNS